MCIMMDDELNILLMSLYIRGIELVEEKYAGEV